MRWQKSPFGSTCSPAGLTTASWVGRARRTNRAVLATLHQMQGAPAGAAAGLGGTQTHNLVILQEDVKVAGSSWLPPGSSRVHQAVTRPAHVRAVSAWLLPSLLPACFAAAHRYLLQQGV